MIPISKPIIGEEELKIVKNVLLSGRLAQGEFVKKFEKEFSSYIGMDYAAATSSGTSALQVGLESIGIKNGDEVITTPFTFIATANSILYQGARPAFADIDSRTFNINPEKIREKINEKTKAVLVVHLYGNPCDMDDIKKICEENSLILIEDCAQAAGAEYKGKKVGSFGDLSVFSFYPTKNMVTGEGGIILTKSSEVAEKAKLIRNHGQKSEYEHTRIGFNYRMSEVEAAIGIAQLKRLDELNEKRIENAKKLTSGLSGLNDIETPFVKRHAKHIFHQYTVKVLDKRDMLLEGLNKSGVEAKVYYPKPVYLQPAYQKMGYQKGTCPVTESVSKRVLSLPVHPSLTKEDLNEIVSKTKQNLKG